VVHAERAPTGAPFAALQVPTEPVMLHASHWPVQPVSQQTPSTQLPDPHWVAPKQALPLPSFAMHSPPPQKKPVVQSVSTEQLVAHAVAPHLYGAHGTELAVGQTPVPPQTAPSVPMPPVQLGARQIVVTSGYAHSVRLVPLQLPAQLDPSVRHAERPPTGVPVAALHVPSEPAMLHASHWPVQPVSQQTPSTQLSEVHSLVALQVVPLAFFAWHFPPAQ
jgi:hypothetical protein